MSMRTHAQTEQFIRIYHLFSLPLFVFLSVCLSRYILISRPSEWSDQLRLKFLEGLDAFLELLKCMQVSKAESHLDKLVCVCVRS